MKLANKVVVVTGGGNGLGRELVAHLIARGARVASIDVDARGLQESTDRYGDRVAAFEGSVADAAFVASLPARVIERFGSVDGLFNNAGIMHTFTRFHQLDRGEVQRVLDVNLVGAISMMHAFLPHLITRPEAHLLNVASVGGMVALPGVSIYGATKAALRQLTEGMRYELMNTHVQVSLALPGMMQTNILANSGVAMSAANLAAQASKGVTAAQAATQILDGVEANAARILVGTDARLLSLFNRLSPGSVAKAVGKQLVGMLDKMQNG